MTEWPQANGPARRQARARVWNVGEAAEVAAHGLEPIVAPTLVHLDEGVADCLVGYLLRAVGATA